MVVEILVALAAGVAICHTHHKKQRINDAFRRDYEARNGPLTKDEWKQLCRERKQAARAEKRERKAEAKYMRRRGSCWPAQPAPMMMTAQAPEKDVKYDEVGAKTADGEKRIWIPVRGPEEEEGQEELPPAYIPGKGVVPPEKM